MSSPSIKVYKKFTVKFNFQNFDLILLCIDETACFCFLSGCMTSNDNKILKFMHALYGLNIYFFQITYFSPSRVNGVAPQ